MRCGSPRGGVAWRESNLPVFGNRRRQQPLAGGAIKRGLATPTSMK